MSYVNTPMGPPPPYAQPNMHQPQSQGFPPPPNTMGWNQNPNYPPQAYPYGQYPPYAHQPYPPQQYPTPPPQQPYHHPPPPQSHLISNNNNNPNTTGGYPTSNHSPLEYPFIQTAKRQMTFLTPDRSAPLFTILYPSSLSLTPQLTIHRGGDGSGPELGGALFHSLTTDKAEAYLHGSGGVGGGGAGGGQYRFRKKFVSQTGLGQPSGGKMKWVVENGALVLVEDGGVGGYVARFVARDGADAGGGTSRSEGRLVIVREGLTDWQFGEVVVTLVAEMERKRRDNEDMKILKGVLGAM